MAYDDFKGKPRLPNFAIPKRYNLNLKPNLLTCTFSGAVSIHLDVVSTTKFLVLNAVDLDIDSSSVSFKPCSSSKGLLTVNVGLLAEDEILVIEFEEEVPIGAGVLSISFSGTLNDQMKGFSRSVYVIKGERKNMAVTQFEPVDARRCFPCWDEPAAKVLHAIFQITLDVPSELIALSNMPVIEEKREGDHKTVYFEESPVMSTYLVAIVVGLFEYLESYTSDGTKVRCYCQIGKKSQGKFALDVAVKLLEFYRKYFDEPYVLPKLDMIAIPDFAAGAMENYGLVTYRENDLLYDEQHSSATDKQWVAGTVAHELAHQWFGNLVTMEWWTHLWLNEGFATWVSNIPIDAFFPEWKIWTQFLEKTTPGLRLDALAESHPIEVEINHAHEADEIFDAISYCKGAAVIHMLQSYLGADCFQRALVLYMRRYAFSNAKTEDLWDVLEEESREPVKDLMHSWTRKKGYPVVSVRLDDRKLVFDQSHFILSGFPEDGLWIVPITMCCGSYAARQTFLLRAKSEVREVHEYAWIKVNVNQTGFYRVKYDEILTAKICHAIEGNLLSPTDRFGVLDDAYALCMGAQQPLTSLLTLIGSFREECDYTVLSKLIDISYQVLRILADAAFELVDSIKQFFINIFQYPVGRLGWEPRPGESHLDSMLRGRLLSVLAKLGHDVTFREAIRRFNAFLDDRKTPLLIPDVRKAAYVALMQTVSTSDKSGFEALLRVYRETDLSQEKERILGSLGSCSDPHIVLEVLNFLLSSEVRSQDAVIGLQVSIEGRETAWNWLKDNWDHISNVWGSGFLIGRFINAIVAPVCLSSSASLRKPPNALECILVLFSSYEMVKEVEEFFASRSKPSIARTLKQNSEKIQINARWVQSIQKEERLAEVVRDLALGK